MEPGEHHKARSLLVAPGPILSRLLNHNSKYKLKILGIFKYKDSNQCSPNAFNVDKLPEAPTECLQMSTNCCYSTTCCFWKPLKNIKYVTKTLDKKACFLLNMGMWWQLGERWNEATVWFENKVRILEFPTESMNERTLYEDVGTRSWWEVG